MIKISELSLAKKDLTTFELIKNIIILATPAMIEMLMHTLVGLADTIMVGRGIGASGLAAVNLANQIIFPTIFVFSAFNIGTTAIVSRYVGAKSLKKANWVASQSYMLNLMIGLVLTLLLLVVYRPLLALFPAEAEVLDYAYQYIDIVIYGQVFMMMKFSLNSSFRGAGDTKTPMLISSAVNIFNILGNWVLIFGVGIFPQLGLRGAAISTTLSRIIGAVVFTAIAFQGQKKITLIWRWFKLKLSLLKRLWRISWAAALEQLIKQSSFVALNYLTITLGTIDYSAYNIIVRLESISFMPIFGISLATSTIVGQYLGANDLENARRSGDLSAICGAVIAFVIGGIYFLFPRPFIAIFINDPAVIETAILPLRLAGIQQLPFAIFIVYSGALNGAGDTIKVLWVTIIRMWVLAIPITYYLINFTQLELVGVLIATNVTFAVTALIYYLYYKSEKWALIEV